MHTIQDFDTRFKIDGSTRKISNESHNKSTLIQYDHNSERFTFEVPSVIEGHSVVDCTNIEIHYLNIDTSNPGNKVAGVYEVNDLSIETNENNEEMAVFSWLVSQNATSLVGMLNFVVRFVCVEDGEVTYVWSSEIYKKITITNGINNNNMIAYEYADVLEQWKSEVLDIAKGKDGVDGKDGADGFSPSVTIQQNENGVTITVTDEHGPTSATITNGQNGKDGQPGQDGAKGSDGNDGYTPVRGVDYWTENDVAQMQAYIDQKLGVIENGTY